MALILLGEIGADSYLKPISCETVPFRLLVGVLVGATDIDVDAAFDAVEAALKTYGIQVTNVDGDLIVPWDTLTETALEQAAEAIRESTQAAT